MALVTFPAAIELELKWRPLRQVQVNRSAYTRVRQALNLGRDSWMVRGGIVPVSTEGEVRLVRGFWAQVQGEQNTFRLIANGPQHTGSNPTAATGAAGATTMTVSGAAALLAGHYVTVPLTTGKKQLALLKADRSGNTLSLDRDLRAGVQVGAAVETIYPYAEVALLSDAEPEDADGTLSWSFEAEEVW
jgi:hypothetical protein